jgi:hypothetical protein
MAVLLDLLLGHASVKIVRQETKVAVAFFLQERATANIPYGF